MSLNHATPVGAPPGLDVSRSGANFVITASSPATFGQVGATGSPTSVSITLTRDQLRQLGLHFIGAAP